MRNEQKRKRERILVEEFKMKLVGTLLNKGIVNGK